MVIFKNMGSMYSNNKLQFLSVKSPFMLKTKISQASFANILLCILDYDRPAEVDHRASELFKNQLYSE